MVLLDYLFASQMVIEWCEAHPLPNDDASLADLLMPARLSMDGADVFGVRPCPGYLLYTCEKLFYLSHGYNK